MLFVLFVMSLREGKLKARIGLFALVHLTKYALGSLAKYTILNVNEGRLWFVFPALLVISNDIFANIVDKMIGKTTLYRLSPKKILEGFLGAFVFTVITGIILSNIHIKSPFSVISICLCS
jgi:phosphatidate cytidylyltransferase